jgi:hypothetical protein
MFMTHVQCSTLYSEYGDYAPMFIREHFDRRELFKLLHDDDRETRFPFIPIPHW